MTENNKLNFLLANNFKIITFCGKSEMLYGSKLENDNASLFSGIYLSIFHILSNVYHFDLNLKRDVKIGAWPKRVQHKEKKLLTSVV